MSASPRLSRLEFFQNGTAMTLRGVSQPVIDSTTILNCTQLPMVWSLLSNPVIPAPSRITLANNAFTAIGILGETVAQDVTTRVRALAGNPNMVYALASDVTIAFGSKWTIAPGVVIKFGRIFSDPIGTGITINGALVADGKPDSLIIFTSSADDAFGGDIRGDGALTQPVPEQWAGITFSPVSNDTASVIDHCRFRYGGYSSNGSLRFDNSGPSVTNTTVTLSYNAVTSLGNASPAFTNCNFDSSTNVPIQMSLVSTPTFTNIQLLGNAYTALGVVPETIAQDLLWPIRALAGRQNMPYLLQGTLTTGLGSTVTVQPGVRVKFTSSGNITIQRAFIAEGRTNPESLIVFTSYRDDFQGGDTNNDGGASAPAVSDWGRVTVDGTAIDPQVRFRNCVFRYGGSGALRATNSSPTADSCMFMFNTTGVLVEGASNPLVRGSSFLGNTSFGIQNTGNSFCVNAEGCWWGAASGPTDASAAGDLCGIGSNAGLGDDLTNNVDYVPFATSGILNPLLGDVSLNGQVLAFDASLVLQFSVSAITLNDLQKLNADVSGVGGITAFDASLILQYVAGLIPAFPAASNAHAPGPDLAPVMRMMARAQGTYGVALGEPVRDGDAWRVPVTVSGGGPLHALELHVGGADAAAVTGVETADGGLAAFDAALEGAAVAIAWTETATGAVASLRVAADGDEAPSLRLLSARVNENEPIVLDVPGPAPDPGPAVSFLARPAPNPARGAARLSLAISAAEAGAHARVRVVDLAGRAVRTLHDGALAAGVHPIAWDLRDESGRAVPAGIYFVRAEAGRFAATHRLVVVR